MDKTQKNGCGKEPETGSAEELMANDGFMELMRVKWAGCDMFTAAVRMRWAEEAGTAEQARKYRQLLDEREREYNKACADFEHKMAETKEGDAL